MNNQTQLTSAKSGIITEQMQSVATTEALSPELVRQEVAAGRIVIPFNSRHPGLKAIGIGTLTRCKINTNIGNSPISSSLEEECAKLMLSLKLGTDTVMDLSTGPRINEIRQHILVKSPIPVGTVPIYQAISQVEDVTDLSIQLLLEIIEQQAEQGVDFMTLHCGLTRKVADLATTRVMGIVSRGGAFIAKWMKHLNRENPLFESFDDILRICRKYDVTISLGDGLRPGCIADACDEAQYGELKILGELAQQALENDVQVMIEGPGHVPLDKIAENMELERKWCHAAPFYVLGPVVTDIAPGYDHITSAIGATLAAYYGASLLCYVTPKEHLGLPNLEDVRQGVVAYKIAAHAADIALNKPCAKDKDYQMSLARFQFDWETQFKIALDGERARQYYTESTLACKQGEGKEKEDFCSMCGPKFCAVAAFKDFAGNRSDLK